MPGGVETMEAMSVRDALARASATLGCAGCDSPRLDAELLLASVLKVTRARLVLDAHRTLDGRAALAPFEALVSRRAAREPVAYILGRREFRRISLAVDGRVLIPRPETELLVQVGLSLGPGARVVDVGTGCGAVALALKDERPDLEVSGVDSSPDALAVARANSRRLGIEVRFAEADLLDSGQYDAVLANLPYVADGCSELAPEITRYEPRSALFGGADGLDVLRRLVALAAAPRRRPSLIALEVGPEQARTVCSLLREAGFPAVEVLVDLAGRERVVVGST